MFPAFNSAVVEIDFALGQRVISMAAFVVDDEPAIVTANYRKSEISNVVTSRFTDLEIILVTDDNWCWVRGGCVAHAGTTSPSDPLPNFCAIAARSDVSVVLIGRSAMTSSKKPATIS